MKTKDEYLLNVKEHLMRHIEDNSMYDDVNKEVLPDLKNGVINF